MNLVRHAGLLERRRAFYISHMAVNVALLAAGWGAFILLGNTWWQIITAAGLAVVFTHSGFLGHDAGHRQIFRTRQANQVVGLLWGNLAIGLAFGWWVDKHHRHHAYPNQEGRDPDIGGADLVHTRSQAAQRHGLGRMVARHQAVLVLPMLLLVGLSLHWSAIKAVLQPHYRDRAWEAVLLGLHLSGYITALVLVLSPLKALVFVLIQQGLFGLYLGSVFAPNHKGMPILSQQDDSDFLRRQVLTARNIRGGWVTDVVFGGLNYQIEHHLFPSMPRVMLRRAQPLIREYCLRQGLPYVETTLIDSYRQALRHLHAVGRAAQPDAAPAG
jgi:fatty acid desaturase